MSVNCLKCGDARYANYHTVTFCLRRQLAQRDTRIAELEVCESELNRLDTYLHETDDDDGTVTATVKVMEQWCVDLRKAYDRITELEGVAKKLLEQVETYRPGETVMIEEANKFLFPPAAAAAQADAKETGEW